MTHSPSPSSYTFRLSPGSKKDTGSAIRPFFSRLDWTWSWLVGFILKPHWFQKVDSSDSFWNRSGFNANETAVSDFPSFCIETSVVSKWIRGVNFDTPRCVKLHPSWRLFIGLMAPSWMQMVQFECSRHWNPSISSRFEVSKIVFCHYLLSGVVRKGPQCESEKIGKFQE